MIDRITTWLQSLGIQPQWVAAAALCAGLLAAAYLRVGIPGIPTGEWAQAAFYWGGAGALSIAVLGFTWWAGQRLPKPTAPGKVGLWVASFNGDTGNESLRLRRAVEGLLAAEPELNSTVEVRALKRSIPGDDANAQFANAQALGRRVNAALVLFGDVGNGVFFPRITIIQPTVEFRQSQLHLQVGLAELEKVADIPPVHQRTMVTVARMLVGFAHYKKEAFVPALAQFQRVLQEFQAGAQQEAQGAVAPATLHFYVGSCARNLSLRASSPIPLLEQAVAAYGQVPRPLNNPENSLHLLVYAGAQNNLGIVYTDLAAHRDPYPNLELAITAYGEALQVFTPKAAPLNYAITQINLGNAYSDLAAHRDPLSNLEKAITAYREARRFFTPESGPINYATAQNNLGNAYGRLAAHRDPQANLDLALAAYREALRFNTPEASPLAYAMIQNNLGKAYGDLAAYRDSQANLDLAIAAYGEALRFRTPEAVPLDYAATQNNLGNAYGNLVAHRDSQANLDLAIAAYREALRFRTPEAAPLDYAATQSNLGNAYGILSAHRDPQANLDLAIAAYGAALRFRTPEASPLDYAATQNNLGNVYIGLAAHRDPQANLELAIAAYGQALHFRTPEAAPLDHAMTQNNLGNAYGNLAAHRDPEANLEQAAGAFARSLILRAAAGTPQAQRTARSLKQLKGQIGTEKLVQILKANPPTLDGVTVTPAQVLEMVARWAT